MRAWLDILAFMSRAFISLLRSPQKPASRSLRAEFFCRFLKLLLDASKHQPIAWLRKRQALLKIRAPRQRQVRFEALKIAGVPCLWCRPECDSEPEPIVIYFHGGGYVIGSVDGYHNVLAHIAVESQARVLAVDYSLAPEHAYPAANRDCLAVATEVLRENKDSPVFLAGDSAGGALAVSTALALSELQGIQQPAGLVLISPWVEPGNNDDSMRTEAPFDILDRELILGWINLYMAGADLRHGDVDFTGRDLGRLPTTYLQVGAREIFIDQVKTFAERAAEQGVELKMDIYQGQFHAFQTFAPLLPGSREALSDIGRYIRSFPLSMEK